MNYLRKALVLITISTIAACGINKIEANTTPINSKATFNKLKAMAAERLRDPEATRFKSEYAMYKTDKGDIILCGTLNGKNAMGGYVGYKPFYMRTRGDSIESFKLPSENDDYNFELNEVVNTCREAASGKIMVSS